MKQVLKLSAILSIVITVITNQYVYTQCSCSASDYGTINTNGWVVGQSASVTGTWGGERSTIQNTVAGATYRISTCSASYDTQLTIYTNSCTYLGYNDDNGPACATTRASIDIVSPGGNLFAVLSEYYCYSNWTSTTVTVTLLSLPSTAYKSLWVSMNTGSSNWCEGETRTVSVTVTNNGTATWTNASPDINIGVKWNAEADYFVRVNANGLAPGATQTYNLTVTAPAAGVNNLTFDVVNEGNCWFGNNNGSCGPGNVVYVSPNITINPLPITPNPVTASPTTICPTGSSNLVANSSSSGTVSGFQDYYSPANWSISHSPVTDFGSVNTSGAPNSISVTSSDGGNYGAHSVFFTILVPVSGNITFNWNYTTTDVDGPSFDLPQYAINGAIIGNMTGFNPSGANSQSGSATIAVTAGQTFSFVMTAMDDILGAATTIFSNFTAPTPVNTTISWYTVPTNGTTIGSSASGANFPVSPSVTTTYYAEAVSSAGCVSVPRIPVTVTVDSPSTSPTISPFVGTVCPNTNTTLTAAGGTAGTGSAIYWYTGPNGTGTFLGTGGSVVVAPTSNTTYYARREGTCNTTADANTTINVKSFIYALNGASTSTYCTDNTGWHHFYSGDEIIFSVQGDLSSAPPGFPQATINVDGSFYQETQGPGTAPGCSINQNPNEERFEMARSWNLDMGGGAPIGTYNIRFYYQPSEKTAIETAANNWMSTYPDCGYGYKYATPNGFYWFKNTGSNYTAPDYDGTHYGGSIGTTTNSVNYSQWASISGFSGGSGAIILEPISALPIELTSFAAICEQQNIKVQWVTASENNTSHFSVERSLDGVNWEVVGVQNAAGNSTSSITYEYLDFEGRGYATVYYRLKQVDVNGESELFGPTVAQCLSDVNDFVLFPNPAGNQVTILLNGEFEESNTYFSFWDVNGKIIKTIDYSKQLGKLIQVDLSDFEPGVYFVQLHNDKNDIKIVKFVKQ